MSLEHSKQRRRIFAPERFLTRPPAIHTIANREVELPPCRTEIEGRFTVELIDARTGLVKRHLEFRNLITDAGLEAIGTNALSTLCNYLAVGTGSTAPAVTDTALVSELFRTTNNGGFGDTGGVDTTNFFAWIRRTRQFNEAEANGNLTELGFFRDATGGTMFNRQLFRDSNGVATTITKTSFDKLRVTYEWRLYADTTKPVQTINVTGVGNVDVTTSVVNFTTYGWFYNMASQPLAIYFGGHQGDNYTFGKYFGFQESNTVPANNTTGMNPTWDQVAGTARPSGVQTTGELFAYAANSKYLEAQYIVLADKGNFATGIGAVGAQQHSAYAGGQHASYMHFFTTKIAKDNTKRFIYSTRTSWARRP